MITQNKQKNIKLIHNLIRWGLAVLAIFLLYRKLSVSSHQEWWSAFLFHLHDAQAFQWLLWCLLLLPANWLLEAVKWRLMMRPLEKVTISRSIQAVLAGLAISVFTPNRIGEYAGRVFVLKRANRITATMATVLGSFSQLVVTIVAGSLATFWLLPHMDEWSPLVLSAFKVIGVFLALVSILFFFNLRLVDWLLSKIPFPLKWKDTISLRNLYNSSFLSKVLFISMVRYVVFALQFYCLLCFFASEVAFLPAVACIAMVYLLMAIVPTVALLELGVRGSVAVAVFALVTDRAEAVLFASSLLWLINLIIPSTIGALLLTRLDFIRNSE